MVLLIFSLSAKLVLATSRKCHSADLFWRQTEMFRDATRSYVEYVRVSPPDVQGECWSQKCDPVQESCFLWYLRVWGVPTLLVPPCSAWEGVSLNNRLNLWNETVIPGTVGCAAQIATYSRLDRGKRWSLHGRVREAEYDARPSSRISWKVNVM